MLFRDLGFAAPPPYAVAKLGSAAAGVDLNWQELAELAGLTYPSNDRTRIALDTHPCRVTTAFGAAVSPRARLVARRRTGILEGRVWTHGPRRAILRR